MARKALSQAEIYDLYQAAKGGDSAALARLNETSSYYGKKANERLTSFKKADMTSTAFTRAEHYLQNEAERSRFARGKKLDAFDAYKNASEARRFIRAKTGTVTREKKREAAVMEKLQKGGYLPENMSKKDTQQFSKFLRSNAWEEIKNTFGSQTMKEIAENIQQGADVDELIESYEDYQNGEIDIDDWLEGWADYD